MKSFTIRGVHKNAMLALRHAASLKREFNADVETSRRTSRGKFSKRGHNFIFKVTPHKRQMWRIVVGYPYYVNTKKKKGKKGSSPDAHTKKAIYYGRTRAEVKGQRERLKRAAYYEIRKLPRWWIQDQKKHPLYRKINVAVSKVDYDVRLIGITQFLDD